MARRVVELAAFVKDGDVMLRNRSQVKAAARDFGDGTELIVTMESAADARSARANRYYWGVVLKAVAEHTGQKAETLHEIWCGMFLPNEHKRVEFFNRLTGEHLVVETDGRRTSKLTGGPFYDYVEECRVWAAEWLGVTTPDPDPQYWRKRAKSTEAA